MMNDTLDTAYTMDSSADFPYEHMSTADPGDLLFLGGLNGSVCSEENHLGFLMFECYKDNPQLIGTFLKAVALAIIIMFTIFGNVLVLLAVAVSRNLRSSTHYLIVNLAVADLLLGMTVLPFSAVFEVTNRWYFGQTFCTIWAAVDVLCCTSSILSLCVISVDRYIGVTRPLAYSTIMFGKRTSFLIALIWVSSILISIGPLFGWKEPPHPDPYHCAVNKQVGYVLFSATGSFYLPMLIIICFYWKIYKAAIRQTKFLECGHKTTKQDVTLRIHLGGHLANRVVNPELLAKFGSGGPPRTHHRPCDSRSLSEGASEGDLSAGAAEVNDVNLLTLAPLAKPEKFSSSSTADDIHVAESGVVLRVHRGGGLNNKGELGWPTHGVNVNGNGNRPGAKGGTGNKKNGRNGYIHSGKGPVTTNTHHHHHHRQNHHCCQANSLTPSPPSSSPERKLNPGFGKIAKFKRQKKAAKTLAIVVGVFTASWLPFFIILPLDAICTSCNIPEWIFSLVFWLGYLNSCLNPIIYACTSREFQRAFRRILCRRSQPKHTSRAIYRTNMYNNNRFVGERPSVGNNQNGIPLHHWS